MYRYYKRSWTKHIDFMFLDAVLLELAFLLAFALRQGHFAFYTDETYSRMAVLLLLLDVVAAFLDETYSGILERGIFRELASSARHVSFVMCALIVLCYALKMSDRYSRLIMGFTWVFGALFAYGGRLILKGFVKRRYDAKNEQAPLLVITDRKHAESVLQVLKENKRSRYKVGAVILADEVTAGGEICGVPVPASINGVVEYVRSTVVEEVFLYLPENQELASIWMDRFQQMGITVHMGLFREKEKTEKSGHFVEKFGGYLVMPSSIKMVTARQMFFKRVLDICGSLVGIVLTGVVCVFVAPIIYIQSPGPIFFSQERIGKNGKRFKLYKFRSMYPDAEERKKELMAQNEVKDGMMFKIKNDPRIFPFGRFLRKTSLDELPQFFNVLKGDMSLVGTRPPTVDEWEKYEYHHMKRLAMKPGITGLWQVSGRSDIKEFDEVVALDTEYISNWKFSLDLKILLKTVAAVAGKRGAE